MSLALERDGANERSPPPWLLPEGDSPLSAEAIGGAKPASIYLHARYYDPQLGTFLSPDPIGPSGGLNSFGYGAGNPANLTDRSGLDPSPNCVTITDGEHAGTTHCGDGTTVTGRFRPWWIEDFWGGLQNLFPIVGGFENNVFAHLLAKREAMAAAKEARAAEAVEKKVDETTTTKQPASTCGGDGQSACEILTCQGADCPRFNQPLPTEETARPSDTTWISLGALAHQVVRHSSLFNLVWFDASCGGGQRVGGRQIRPTASALHNPAAMALLGLANPQTEFPITTSPSSMRVGVSIQTRAAAFIPTSVFGGMMEMSYQCGN